MQEKVQIRIKHEEQKKNKNDVAESRILKRSGIGQICNLLFASMNSHRCGGVRRYIF